MKSLLQLESFARPVIASLGATTLVLVQHSLFSQVSNSLFFIIAFAAMTIVMLVCEHLFNRLVHCRKMRRLAMGDRDIEGHWVDVSVDLRTNTITGYGIITIYYEDGNYRISGRSYDLADNLVGSFASEHLLFTGSKLRYAYRVRYAKSTKPGAEGYCECDFNVGNGLLSDYVAKFFKSISSKQFWSIGKRLDSIVGRPLPDGRPSEVDAIVQSLSRNNKVPQNFIPIRSKPKTQEFSGNESNQSNAVAG